MWKLITSLLTNVFFFVSVSVLLLLILSSLFFFSDEGIYNTYVLDSDYQSFGLLLHCAEKSGSTRYLSSLILSRNQSLKINIINYLREKLPRYDIDLEYMFPVAQKNCHGSSQKKFPQTGNGSLKTKNNKGGNKKQNPLKNHRI